MSNNDFASLVVLSFKRPDSLKRSLESLLNNSDGVPYELIVHDDGAGSDGSGRVNMTMLSQMARQRLLTTLILNAGDNLGVGTAMNRGFSIARGRWVVKLDADLEYRPGWLKAGVDLLEKRPDVAVVGFFDFRNYNPKDDRFNKLSELRDSDGKMLGYEVDDFVGSAFMMRRADWLKYGISGINWTPDGAHFESGKDVGFVGFEEGSAAFAEDVAWKKYMQSLGFKMAITTDDTISNFGFGLGNSTVVVEGDDGKPVVAKISNRPLLFGMRGNE